MSAYAQITGHLGQEVELRYTNSGNPVVNLSIASNRQKKNQAGERVSAADWFRITVFGRDAEIIAQYARKGSALAFNGRLQTDSFVDRAGQQRTTTCLIADSFEFVPAKKSATATVGQETQPAVQPERAAAKGKADDDDLPF